MTQTSDNPTIREQLDAVRPGSNDLQEEELRDAARAVAESDEWAELLAAQQSFDNDVAGVMQSVEVPEGLHARLQDALATARGDEMLVSTADRSKPLRHSAIRKLAALAVGLLLLVGLSWMLMTPGGSQLTLDEIRHLDLLRPAASRAIDISQLPTFDNSFAVELPSRTWRSRVHRQSELKGLDWTGDGRHDGAIYEFQVNGRIHGYLLILPSTQIVDPPDRQRIVAAEIDYEPVSNVAWVNPQTELTYICYVDRGSLDRLVRLLHPHAA